MGRMIQNLLSQRSAGLLGIVVLVLVIYLVGTLSGVNAVWLHAAAAAAVVLGTAALFLRQRLAARAANSLEAALKAQGQSQAAGARPDQRAGIEELKSQFDESLDLLRKSKMGRGALHSIPWYMLIGPPGSGKSTLLRQSGLSFPYMTKGRSAIRGLGGTKNCDWWFADRGILLDTAGRYTTEAEDREEWMSFLRLLKRGRGRRPVNGVIVAVGLAELLESTEAELGLYAENVRDRVDELTRELQTVFPIYVVFTKCDRLRGFVETFDTLTKEQRRQVWGFTFPFRRGKEFVVAEQFGKEFDELYRSLTVRRVDLLSSDHFKKRKAQVYAFPLQFLRLKERLQNFLSQLQQPNPYQEVSPIRGIYFTSGTQEGTTIDRILKVLRPAELELDVPEESRRCYFVDDLFNRVVFEDAPLAAPTASSQKKDQMLRVGGLAVLGVLAIVTVVTRWGAMSGFAATCQQIEENIAGSRTKDHGKVRAALDAQRALLDGGSHHLERGGVKENLAAHYDQTLKAYASERLDAHVNREANEIERTLPAEGVVLDDAARARAYQDVLAGDERLARISEGLRVLGTRNAAERAPGRAAALALWQAAVDPSEAAQKHFDHLFARNDLDLQVPAVAGAMRGVRARLQSLLSADDKRDVAAATALPFAELFHTSWNNLRSVETRFYAIGTPTVAKQNWSPTALSVSEKGPLLSGMLTKADTSAVTLERFFVEFQKDVDDALARKGATSQRELRQLPGSGWAEHVQKKKAEFLDLVDEDFANGWSRLLQRLAGVARAAGEANEEDRCGVKRLAVVPELVAAYRVAREVLGRRGVVPDDIEKELAKLVDKERARHQPKDAEWAREPGFPTASPQLSPTIDRARRANLHLQSERRRIAEFDWGIPALRERFQELELSLVESICAREWRACRADLAKFAADKPFKAWRQMLAGFPFAPDEADEADAAELAAAVGSMAELAETIAQLEPKDAFALDPEFAADLAAAAELGRILYGGTGVKPKPSIEATLTIEKGGKVAAVKIDGEGRSLQDGPGQPWNLGEPESLGLEIRMLEGERLSFRDLIYPRGQQVPESLLQGARLVTGMWSLKRLFAMGEVQTESELERRSALRIRGRQDQVFLYAKTSRKEAAAVFDADWPGDRYALGNTMWKLP